MTNKRTLLINRKECWVRNISDMDWHKDSNASLDYKEKNNSNSENSKGLSGSAFVGNKSNLIVSKKL